MHRIAELVVSKATEVTNYLADPVTGTPVAPAGLATPTNTIWGYGLYIVAVFGAFGLLIAGGTAWSNYKHGQSNETVGRVGAVLAGVTVAGIAGGVIGAVTGT